jgi:prepilin-type N-terminal cleavage/methylation domain-containing protein
MMHKRHNLQSRNFNVGVIARRHSKYSGRRGNLKDCFAKNARNDTRDKSSRALFARVKFNRQKKAFTLVELMVSLTIIAIVTAMIIVSSGSMKGSVTADVEARKIVDDLVMFREMAVAKYKDYCIRFNSNDYVIYQNACVPAIVHGDFLKQEKISATISSPAVPFEVIFFQFRPPPTYRLGGTAFSAVSVNNELMINLNYQGNSKIVRLFQDTGYVKVE